MTGKEKGRGKPHVWGVGGRDQNERIVPSPVRRAPGQCEGLNSADQGDDGQQCPVQSEEKRTREEGPKVKR